MENKQIETPREVNLAEMVQDDSVLRTFADEVASDSDVDIYAASGPLRLKEGGIPPVQPEKHCVADGREAWVFRFPDLQAKQRPFVLIVVEGITGLRAPVAHRAGVHQKQEIAKCN